jgi:putative transposase
MVSENGFSVKLLCRVLELSRSGYYAWLSRPESSRKRQTEALALEIKKIHEESRGTYGLPRIKEKLKQLGHSHGNSRIEAVMKRSGISGLKRRRFKIKTTDSNHESPIAERVFKTEEPHTHPVKMNQLWASDISYIHTDEGVLYLATYLDLFTRKLVGFATDDHMRTELLLAALNMALMRQGLLYGELTSHSDRGSQYASEDYRAKLKFLGIKASMSRSGNCYDNAFAESFFATLKKELIYRTRFTTKAQAKKAIFEYIEVWYNRNRIHSSIGYKTPIQFEESLAA